MPDNRLFVSAYYLKGKDLGYKKRSFNSCLHKIRDGLAIAEVLPEIQYISKRRYSGVFVQVPYYIRVMEERPGDFFECPLDLGSGDLVFQATRPPLSDSENDIHRPVDESRTDLEKWIFKALGLFFATCDRNEVFLRDGILSAKDAKYAAIKFKQNASGKVECLFANSSKERVKKVNQPEDMGIGYLVSIPELYPNGPRFINAFSMGGAETAVFSNLLRTHFNEYLKLAITCAKPRLWIFPFVPKTGTPYPFFHFGDLNSKRLTPIESK